MWYQRLRKKGRPTLVDDLHCFVGEPIGQIVTVVARFKVGDVTPVVEVLGSTIWIEKRLRSPQSVPPMLISNPCGWG